MDELNPQPLSPPKVLEQDYSLEISNHMVHCPGKEPHPLVIYGLSKININKIPLSLSSLRKFQGSKELCGQECSWRKRRLPWKQGAIAECCTRGRAVIVDSLPLHQPLPPWALDRECHWS